VDSAHGIIVTDNVLNGWWKIWTYNSIIILEDTLDGLEDTELHIILAYGLQIV
jgi:hypothetical protein